MTKEKENKLETYREVELPHLRASVKFLDMSKLKGIPSKGAGFTTIFERKENDGGVNIAVFFQDIEDTVKHIENTPIIAHELVHVIQHLCEHMSSDINNEVEHTAYLMHYLMEQLLGNGDA